MAWCVWRPHVHTALDYARERGAAVYLTYNGRAREDGPVVCSVTAVDGNQTALLTDETFLPDELNGFDCRLYFKMAQLPDGVEPLDEREVDSVRYGFYCRSYVMSTRRTAANSRTEILVKTPARSLQRELRRHVRLPIKPEMIRRFCFWFAPALPASREQIHEYLGRYTTDIEECVSLIDISAGGAFVGLKNYADLDELSVTPEGIVLLYVELNSGDDVPLRFFLSAHCTHLDKNKKENRLNLHLQFDHQLGTPRKGETLQWIPVTADAGVLHISRWVGMGLKDHGDALSIASMT